MNTVTQASRPWRWAALVGRVLISPLTLLLAFRRSLTGASVTLLLITIVSLNIVWGYPWVGVFSSTLTMLVLGGLGNRLVRPRLKVDFSLPTSAPLGQPFLVTMHLRNDSRLPAMNLMVGFVHEKTRRRDVSPASFQVLSKPCQLEMILPRDRVDAASTLSGSRRGIAVLPNVSIESLFPFYLFRSSNTVASQTTIAITPQLIDNEDDPIAGSVLGAIGAWSNRLLSGDAMNYTGSREYQVGMPVRRWDFSSWARLGRPIVREYQSPSVQTVTIIVDTFRDSDRPQPAGAVDPVLERMLSLAAVAVTELCRRQVRLRLHVTHESTESFVSPSNQHAVSDSEPLLIQLAAAETVDQATADRRIAGVFEMIGRCPTLLLTTRSQELQRAFSLNHVTIIQCNPSNVAELAVHV